MPLRAACFHCCSDERGFCSCHFDVPQVGLIQLMRSISESSIWSVTARDLDLLGGRCPCWCWLLAQAAGAGATGPATGYRVQICHHQGLHWHSPHVSDMDLDLHRLQLPLVGVRPTPNSPQVAQGGCCGSIANNVGVATPPRAWATAFQTCSLPGSGRQCRDQLGWQHLVNHDQP